MREELRCESSTGVALEGMSFRQKLLAGFVSFVVTGLLVALPAVI